MADLQIKLTLGNLDIFLQGDGELVYKVFSDVRNNGLGLLNEVPSVVKSTDVSKDENIDENTVERKEVEPQESSVLATPHKAKSRKKNGISNVQLIKDLDLSGTGSAKSLKAFMEEKNPSTNVQKTTAFVYYLQNFLEIDEITIDHIFTCYKSMNYRIPNNLQQNLSDTSSSKYGYISRKDGKYSMTILGSNFIEHDLPKGE